MKRDSPLSACLLQVMVAIALNQPDPRERDAMLAILRKDGWLPAETQEAKCA